MSEIKTKISTYDDVIDLFGEEKAADMLSEALDWSTIDPKNDKKNIMERKPLLLDPYMTYEGEDYCKHIVAGFLGDRDLDWASGYIDEEKIKNGQVMPADLKSALSMALDNELSTSWAYLDALSSQCAEICNKFAGYIESAGLARGVLVPGEYELDSNALNADVSERFNIQYGFQCDQMIDAMQFDMTLILTEKVDSMDGYRLIQSLSVQTEKSSGTIPTLQSRGMRRLSVPIISQDTNSTIIKTPISPGSPSSLSRCTGRTIHPSSSRQISASRTPTVLPLTNRSHSPATTKTSWWT